MPVHFWDQLSKAAFTIFRNSSIQFLCFFGLLFISGFILTLLSRWTSNSFRQFRFPSFGLYTFGIIGIPVHEFCHAVFAKIFFHDVKSIKWFDPKGKGGSYGTVVHYYNEQNIYHRIGLFFIGMGPVLLAPIFLAAIYYWLVPSAAHLSFEAVRPLAIAESFSMSFIKSQNWTSASFYLFLYLTICLTSQMELSPDDFKIARGGILPFSFIFIVMNALAFIFNFNLHLKFIRFFNTALALWSTFFVMAILISFINLVLCFFILSVLNRFFGRQIINPFQD